ncbi:Cse1-domain-containing protein [Phakopsora pachyrhizi]|nr:Cse1-domain-containing protein [Phakopsora pachyrhizi]
MNNSGSINELCQCLVQSIDPDPSNRRLAEQRLENAKRDSSFGQLMISITQDQNLNISIRQASALAFKNWIKGSWPNSEEDQSQRINQNDRQNIKSRLIPVLISLAQNHNLQVQYTETVSIIASIDFPGQWPDLIDQIVQNFNQNDWTVNNTLLSTAHGIFKRWRSQFRSDTLFLEIKYVLERFCGPYLQLFKLLDNVLTNVVTTLPPKEQKTLARSLLLMIQIYYDLNSQDIPEFFEDNLSEFMNLLHKYLTWEIPSLVTSADDDDEAEAGDLEKIRSSICEVAELYSQRYLDVFPMMGSFVETCWALLVRLGPQQRYDILVSKAIRFLSVVVRMQSQKNLFESQSTLEAFCEKIVLPNMFLRDFEVEMFEEDPTEYVRRDLEGSDSETRRQAATEFTRALMEHFESQITTIITKYANNYLAQYAASPAANWRLKDAAVSLLTSVGSLRSTSAGGVTSTNTLANVVTFFSDHVVQDIASEPSSKPSPIIVADAIKFLRTFRNQLNRDQLISVVPLLVPHLNSDLVVIHTYAASTIERILFIKRENRNLFLPEDVKDISLPILSALFTQILRGETPQQIAQNSTLMKCVMRVIVTTKHNLQAHFQTVLSQLLTIINEISKNPSNPQFNHYTFESVSALIRFTISADPTNLPKLEQALFPAFSHILTQDIQDFSPFVFQILSQMLELRSIKPETLPDYYKSLLQPLLTPALWEVRGNIPGLVRLLKAYLTADSASVIQENRVPAMLGVFQKLISSKINDVFGFELLEALFEYLPVNTLAPYLRNVFILLFTRLQQSKTEKFTSAFLYTIMFVVALEKAQLTPDFIINAINGVQPGLFCQVMEGALLPAVPSTPLKNRRVVALGHISLLTRSRALQQEAEARLYLPILTSVLRLLTLPQLNPNQNLSGVDGSEVKVSELEEFGYQVGFSKLGASENVLSRKDPFDGMGDPRDALASGLVKAGDAQPGKIPALIAQVPADLATPYLQWLAAAGYQIR